MSYGFVAFHGWRFFCFFNVWSWSIPLVLLVIYALDESHDIEVEIQFKIQSKSVKRLITY